MHVVARPCGSRKATRRDGLPLGLDALQFRRACFPPPLFTRVLRGAGRVLGGGTAFHRHGNSSVVADAPIPNNDFVREAQAPKDEGKRLATGLTAPHDRGLESRCEMNLRYLRLWRAPDLGQFGIEAACSSVRLTGETFVPPQDSRETRELRARARLPCCTQPPRPRRPTTNTGWTLWASRDSLDVEGPPFPDLPSLRPLFHFAGAASSVICTSHRRRSTIALLQSWRHTSNDIQTRDPIQREKKQQHTLQGENCFLRASPFAQPLHHTSRAQKRS